MKSTPIICLLLVISWLLPSQAQAASERELTTNSAIYLLRSAMRISREGREISLLKAIRQLQDPTLSPLFEELAQSPHPVLKVHGILGLAECNPQRKLDLLRIANIEQPSLQAQVISAAMDSDLLSDDEANQLINWPGLDIGIRVLIATQQIQRGIFDKPHILQESSLSDNLAQQYFALLLQARLGQADALTRLDAIHTSDDPLRDRVREMLLRSALRYNMEMLGPWAMHIATEPNVSLSLGLLGLKAAMRFKVPQAQTIWNQQFQAATELAQQTRLALVVLRESESLAPSLFDSLIAQENLLLRNIGHAGKAIASRQGISENVINLVGMENPHPLVSTWALIYAQTQATPEDAQAILLSLVLCYENASPHARANLLENAISATQTLLTEYAPAAQALLKPILENAQTQPMLLRGIVLAMIRSNSEGALQLAHQVGKIHDSASTQLLLLLKAKQGTALSRNQLHKLALMVRGGGLNDDALRVQAGWTYIKQTQQVQSALTRVMNQ